jgi:hypothetical protein
MNPINDDTKFYKCNKKKACNVSTQCGNLCTITQDEKFAVDLGKSVTYKEIRKDLEAASINYYIKSKSSGKYITEKDYQHLVEVNSKKEAKTFNAYFTEQILKFDSDLEKEVATSDNANIIN